jgi:hypothetical protein
MSLIWRRIPIAGRSIVLAILLIGTLTFVGGAASQGTARTAAHAVRATALPTWRSVFDWPAGDGYVGWHSATTAPDDYGMQAALGAQSGLWLWPLGGHKTYDTADDARWTFTAPGTTRLLTAQLSYAWNNKLLAHHCIDIGFLDGSGNVVTHQETCKPPPQSPQDLTLTDPGSNPTAKVLFIRIHVDCGGESACKRTIPALDPLETGAFARLLKADLTLVDDDDPALTPSGQLYDLRDTYINGTLTYGVTVHADDAGSGIAKAWLERQGFQSPTGILSSQDAPCDPHHTTPPLDARICPASFEYQTSVDSTTLSEGTSHFFEKAQDVAGNVGSSAEWKVYVDRTPPNVPAGISLVSFRSASGEASLSWGESQDPPLPDGVAGSGLDRYEIRYQLNGGGWSDWAGQPDAAFIVSGANSGDLLEVEVRSVDAVGNTSAAASASFTLADSEPGLTGGDVSSADGVATSDARVADLIGGRPYSIAATTPWTSDSGQPLGAEVSITWGAPVSITADWPSPDVVAHYTAANVTGLSIRVSLSCNQIVSIDPDEDSYATDTPTIVSSGSGTCGIPGSGFTALNARSAAAAVQWIHNVRPIHVGPDVFYNYDFTTPSLSGKIDWPIDLVFWNNALTPNQVKLYDFGASIADPAYLKINQGGGPNFWDTDQGSKSGIPGCNTVEHYRVYKDDNAASTRFTTNWGFYIVASAHRDRFEECKGIDPFTGQIFNIGDHWSGRSERAEGHVADKAATVWGAGAIQRSFVELYNEETTHREGDHRWENNGKATKIKVCIDRLGHNTVCP